MFFFSVLIGCVALFFEKIISIFMVLFSYSKLVWLLVPKLFVLSYVGYIEKFGRQFFFNKSDTIQKQFLPR